MTNEEFKDCIQCFVDDYGMAKSMLVHAKKLVEALESAKDVAANPHANFDKILILRGKLQDLERY